MAAPAACFKNIAFNGQRTYTHREIFNHLSIAEVREYTRSSVPAAAVRAITIAFEDIELDVRCEAHHYIDSENSDKVFWEKREAKLVSVFNDSLHRVWIQWQQKQEPKVLRPGATTWINMDKSYGFTVLTVPTWEALLLDEPPSWRREVVIDILDPL